MTNISRGLYLILTICYIGVIFYFSSLPGSSLSIGSSTLERIFWNLGHIPFYGILAFLLTITFRNKKKANSGFLKSSWKVLIIALCIAIFDELNQSRIPGRSVSLMDLLLDGIGIITGLWIIHLNGKRSAITKPVSATCIDNVITKNVANKQTGHRYRNP